MEFRVRKLLAEAVNATNSNTVTAICTSFCGPLNKSGYCPSPCKDYCPDICKYDFDDQFPPTSPTAFTYHRSRVLTKFLIVLIVVISVCFVGICCYTVYVRYFANRRRSRPPPEEDQENHDEFLDEDLGPVVDHHVWYINTVGLQPSVISAIMVCKYKRGEGLVEGTECSVCLNEFQEDETLRLLPKCSHAFHIPCIDTWLRSHTNCPMCRAPIVKNTAAGSSSSSAANIGNSGTGEDAVQNRILEADEESDTEMEDEAEENELGVESGRKRGEILDEEVQPIRRSFSLDSLSALKITQNLAIVPSVEPNRISVKANKLGGRSFSQRIVGDLSLLRAMGGSSSVRSSQDGSSLMQRSLSCYGKLLLPASNLNLNQNSILPL